MQNDPRVSIKAAIWLGTRALLLRNPRGELELPGGRIEPGETPFETLTREVTEELGVSIECGAYVMSGLFEVVPNKFVFVEVFHCQILGDPQFTLSLEHEGFELVEEERLTRHSAIPLFYVEALRISATHRVKRSQD